MSIPERDLENKLEEMEADLNQQVDPYADVSKPGLPKIEINPSPQVQKWIDSGKELYNNLPKFGQVAVLIGGIWLGFSIVGAVLHVVSSIFTLGVLGIILYVGYRLFTNNSNS